MKKNIRSIIIFFVFVSVCYGASVHTTFAATKPLFEVSGWVPYWRTATGTADAILHMDTFKEISPFAYTVKNNGTLLDQMHVDADSWQALIHAAQGKKVKVIPTVMWDNTERIDAVLRSPKLRKAHIKEIVSMVNDNGFDGVDIDYEGKAAETKKYFSLFLKELYAAMGKKFVICTIEARTPLEARFSKIPNDIQYANDFVAINNYCDRVRIMAYDQGAIDLTLNDAAVGPYVPVADPKWVEKVIRLAMKTIAKKKIVIGVPTYGYEFEVTPLSEGFRYDLLTALNPKYALDTAQEFGVTPQRNVAGELSFTYMPTTSPAVSQTGDIIQSNNDLLASALASSGTTTPAIIVPKLPMRIVWWSDAQAIRDKVLLAKKLGVRGVAIFKVDGGEDPLMWDVLK